MQKAAQNRISDPIPPAFALPWGGGQGGRRESGVGGWVEVLQACIRLRISAWPQITLVVRQTSSLSPDGVEKCSAAPTHSWNPLPQSLGFVPTSTLVTSNLLFQIQMRAEAVVGMPEQLNIFFF